jgi:hypothetical protein
MSISAMKYALDVLENYVEDPRCEAHRATAVHFLEQAIAEEEKIVPSDHPNSHQQEPVSELLKLMAEDGVTGVLIEVHRGPLSKSIRTWGECDCPTSTDNDVTIEVRP